MHNQYNSQPPYHHLVVQIDISPSLLTTLHCPFPSISHSYLDKNIRTAFSNVSSQQQQQQNTEGAPPRAERNTTKVIIDVNGLMKVTHMLQINFSQSQQELATHPLVSEAAGERDAAMAGMAVAQFVMLPLDDEAMIPAGDDGDVPDLGGEMDDDDF